ncbi:MAG: hypothetical protein AABW67_06535 [Nanoarchaeota archaeon]
MTLEFICSIEIESGKKIEIPVGVNYYIRKSKTISPKKGREPRINFFKVNPSPTYKMKQIPENVKYIGFDMEQHKFNIEYGQPRFYDWEGNILKMGDK